MSFAKTDNRQHVANVLGANYHYENFLWDNNNNNNYYYYSYNKNNDNNGTELSRRGT